MVHEANYVVLGGDKVNHQDKGKIVIFLTNDEQIIREIKTNIEGIYKNT